MKIMKLFLITGILVSSLFWPISSLAVTSPSGLAPCEGVQPLSVLLDWSDETVHHYELYYKKADETTWQDRYPSISQYLLSGLSPSPSPDNPIIYQWYVISCGDLECNDGAPSGMCSFATEELAAPPENGGNGGGEPFDLTNPLNADTLQEALNSFLNFLFFLAMALGPIMIVYAAFLILTSGGDSTKISRGRQIIIWTLIAVALVLFAKGLPVLIKGAFGG